ncbi:hypothetical protein CR203_12220 [Salipaludibacillus neizhouensis]|uniref:Uncharacterized protein n=1 Tax=Salipaludibacillus neizhouensis TaxID=885475 RepID=A0A3A9KRG3_9BACI|nr:YwqI/YxiC family protein [Salipaludibacillus neizhouensis]RKL67266.1 hypothetical protein CR203_12220 [Salipaludibacillus neizhouensis]
MSDEIKIQRGPVNKGIKDLQSSSQSLNTSFSKEIEGENKLEIVTNVNEIKQQYDEIMMRFTSLMTKNLQSTEEAVTSMEATDEHVAHEIGLIK